MGDDRITLRSEVSLDVSVHIWMVHRAVQLTSIAGYLFSRETCETGVPVPVSQILSGRRHAASTFAIVKQMLPVVLLLSIGVVRRLTCNSVRSHTNGEWYLFPMRRVYGRNFNGVRSLSRNRDKTRFIDSVFLLWKFSIHRANWVQLIYISWVFMKNI